MNEEIYNLGILIANQLREISGPRTAILVTQGEIRVIQEEFSLPLSWDGPALDGRAGTAEAIVSLLGPRGTGGGAGGALNA